jgi:hypothetical protein
MRDSSDAIYLGMKLCSPPRHLPHFCDLSCDLLNAPLLSTSLLCLSFELLAQVVTLRSDGDNDVGRRHNYFSVGDRKWRVLGHFNQQVDMKVSKRPRNKSNTHVKIHHAVRMMTEKKMFVTFRVLIVPCFNKNSGATIIHSNEPKIFHS